MLKDRLDKDLKAAMLAGDKARVSILKLLKSAILYKEVELGIRESGLSDQQISDIFAKEAKKRREAIKLYEIAGRNDRAELEVAELEAISEYLPAQLSDAELDTVIEECIVELGGVTAKDMGKLIGLVKAKTTSTVSGERIAGAVKQKIV